MKKSCLALATLALAACASTPGKEEIGKASPNVAQTVRINPPPQNVFVRVSFDDNPKAFIGRFIPDALPRTEIDENRAATTRCSEHVAFEEVNAGGTFDSSFNGSNAVSGSLGVVPVASAELAKSSEGVLRVKYVLKKKLRAVVKDPAAFDRCCKAAADQCAKQYIGEFWYGSGSIYQVLGAKESIEASGVAKTVSAAIDYKDDVAWKQLTEFQDMYFAFRTNETGLGSGVGAMAANDCSWANAVPTSLDGQYFVGVSQPMADQAMARDDAMRNARTQVVKFIGETIKTASKTTASAVEGVLADERVTAAVAEGLVERVKDQRWCDGEKVATPKGELVQTKVLAFFPTADKAAVAKASVDVMLKTLKAQGKLTPKLEKELTAAAADVK